jgi:hypothetical protein
MSSFADNLALTKAILSNPQMIRVDPAVNWFLLQYMRKFRVRNVGGNLVLHSHLPPVNSVAYTRFIDEHLLGGTPGPSHAQIGVTNACPQRCEYCYNRNKRGDPMDRDHRGLVATWPGWESWPGLLARAAANRNPVQT